jgi:spore germination cell wall hydrolase CwlJ-like protein
MDLSKDQDILARTLYGEARNEYNHPKAGLAALIAVGNVVMNRVSEDSWYGKTPLDVCLKPFQFSCWNQKDPNRPVIMKIGKEDDVFQVCLEIAGKILKGTLPDLTRGSNHYYSTTLEIPPVWADPKYFAIQIGRHRFYKL